MSNEDAELHRKARARAISKMVYQGVVGLYAVAAIGMIGIWWLTTPGGYFWPIWPVLGMSGAAIVWGLAIYAVPVFRVSERRIDAEMQRLQARP